MILPIDAATPYHWPRGWPCFSCNRQVEKERHQRQAYASVEFTNGKRRKLLQVEYSVISDDQCMDWPGRIEIAIASNGRIIDPMTPLSPMARGRVPRLLTHSLKWVALRPALFVGAVGEPPDPLFKFEHALGDVLFPSRHTGKAASEQVA